jgi:hypothetical protein
MAEGQAVHIGPSSNDNMHAKPQLILKGKTLPSTVTTKIWNKSRIFWSRNFLFFSIGSRGWVGEFYREACVFC